MGETKKTLSLRRSMPSFSRPRDRTSSSNATATNADDASVASTAPPADSTSLSTPQSSREDVNEEEEQDAAKVRRLKSKKSFIHTMLQRYGRTAGEANNKAAQGERTPSSQDTSTEEQR
jgi:hypothetical protein